MINSVGLRGVLFPDIVDKGYLFGGGGRYLLLAPDVIEYHNYYCFGVGVRRGHKSGALFLELGYAIDTRRTVGLLTVNVGFLFGAR